MDISERIKKLREEYGITSNELANITGIHPVSIRKYESKKMVPGKEVIDKMCEALRLPPMILEGIPKQYTDYSYLGDFYQLLFLLYANGTLIANPQKKDGPFKQTTFTLNPELSKYIQIKNGDEIIPLENITIQSCIDQTRLKQSFYKFETYLDYIEKANAALSSKRWNTKTNGETKEEYATRLINLAEETQMELMLEGHNWEDHMTGIGHSDELHAQMNEFILSGGDYYGFIMQADLPEFMKEKYIKAYEDAYISEIIHAQNPPYPANSTKEDIDEWIKSMIAQEKQYKLEHPDYKEQARKHAKENAQKARDATNNQ